VRILAFLAVATLVLASSHGVRAQTASIPSASPAPSPEEQPTTPSPSAVPSAPLGVIPFSVPLTVTGNPASTDFLQNAIVATLDRAISPTLQPGAIVRYGTIAPVLQPLQSGFLTAYTVAVTISGAAGAAPLEGTSEVDVQNVALPNANPTLLALDDDPEHLTANGVSYSGTVAAQAPLRLYYYHENAAAERRLAVVLSATQPSRVQIIHAAGGPNVDVMSVGHAVSRSFVLAEPANEGLVLDVTPDAPVLVRDAQVGIGEGIAGALDVIVLMGGPVTATVLAVDPASDPRVSLAAARLAQDGHQRHGTFSLGAFDERSVAYDVGGPDASLRYGDRVHGPTNINPEDAGRDSGDYGVLERFAFDLNNPTSTAATVYLYAQPDGGVVRNSYIVDGTLVDMGCARLAQRYLVASKQLDPHASATMHVLTMPDGGSNYPVELGVTTVAPLASTPPLSAADGCFPKPGGAPNSAPAGTPSPGAVPQSAAPQGTPSPNVPPPPPTPVPT
jgi:hypothetical protein